ncbi:MAG: TetR/AcrR family transcriptional regulator [Acidimicrobiales bacterium]
MTDLESPIGRREAHKRATRLAIMDAAVGLIAQKGFEDTTVREISDAAGVTERTFYRYFTGKDGILAEQALEWLAALRDAIIGRPSEESPFTAVRRALVAVLANRRDNRARPVLRLLDTPRPLRILQPGTPRPLLRVEEAVTEAARQRVSAGDGLRLDSSAEMQTELLGRVAVAALRSAVSRHRVLISTPEGSPGVPALLDAAFASMVALVEEGRAG